MASQITPSQLQATLGISGLTGHNVADISQIINIAGITEVYNNTITVPAAGQLLADADMIDDGGVFDFDYGIIINKDDTNTVRIRRSDAGGHTVDESIAPSRFMVINNSQISVSETEAAFAAYTDITKIEGDAPAGQEADVQIILMRLP